MLGKKNIIWFISFFIGSIIVLYCLFIHLYRNSNEIIYLGLNAEIIDIDTDNHILYVKDINNKDFTFGDRCAIDCNYAIKDNNLIYVNYNSKNDVRSIHFSQFKIGDEIIVSLSSKEKQNAKNNVVVAKQVQLSTQRMNRQE